MDEMDETDSMAPVAQAPRSGLPAYYPGGPIAIPTALQVASPFPMRATSAAPPDSAFATIMSLPQPQPRPPPPQPRASPLVPRPVPAPPKTKSFSLPNALSRVGTPVAKGTWILGRGDEADGNGDAAPAGESSRFLVAGIDILANPHLPVVPESPLKDRREAVLFMHYVHTLSLWIDTCDKQAHFGTEVPRRALRYPLLAYGILAFACQHLELTTGADDTESAGYYNQALRLLIPELDRSADHLDENVLCGIVLLRLYEERSGRPSGKDITEGLGPEELDMGTHLLGSSRVLKNFNSTGSGGLAEACFWVVLRQDMFISLTRSTPPSVPLENIIGSRAFTEFDPESVANRIVYLCSRILCFALDPLKNTETDWWDRLDADVDAWNKNKPWHFQALWLEEPSQSANAPTAFPTVRLVRHGYVAGYQHYHMAKMLLAIFDPRLCSNGFDTFRRRQRADRIALAHLRTLIGISISNPEVINSRFTACHCIQACGSCLRDPREREEVVTFLEDMEQLSGWRCKYVIKRLREEWSQDYVGH